MLVGRTAPAPSRSHSAAQATASLPTGLVPPATTSSNPDGTAGLRRASMAMVMRSAPNFSAASRTSPGRFTAALFRDTFAAPAASTSSMSSRLPMPPPNVRGSDTAAATLRTQSRRAPRFSSVAAMSSMARASAPSRW